VLGHLELLEMGIHGETTPAQQEAMARIGAATRHLRGLIEEVLSFARIESGRMEVSIEPTDLCALTEEVAAVIEPLAQQKSLRFDVEPCSNGLAIPTDPEKVRQILINLAGNAVKFTSEGGVRIGIREQDQEVLLTVSDTGPGIAQHDQARLFQPFEQLQTGFTRSHGGTGLGLYLSGQLAELLDGRIEVESAVGKGSVFALVLPRSGPRSVGGKQADQPAVAGARA
jgi:signal transduction histidine kinase